VFKGLRNGIVDVKLAMINEFEIVAASMARVSPQ